MPIVRSRKHISLIILFVAGLLAAVLLSGCSNNEPPPTPTIIPITGSEFIARSQTAMGNLKSFKFKLAHDSGFTTLSGTLQLTTASGTVAPNGLDLEAEAKIGRAFVRTKAIVIGERTWMTNIFTGAWSEIPPEDSPFSFLDPVKMVADILGDTQTPGFVLASEPTGEVTIIGQITGPTLAPLVDIVDPDAVPSVEMIFDPESYILKKIIISGVVQPEDEPDTIRVITLSEFDEQVSLEPPI
jgi:hypothetical protein